MSANDLYRQLRNRIRELDFRESMYVLWAYSLFLEKEGFQFPAGIEIADQLREAELPQTILSDWRIEQIAREVIRHADIRARRGRTLRQWNTIAYFSNSFTEIEDQIRAEMPAPGNNIYFELLRIAHRQITWQQQRFHWHWLIRYYKLFRKPTIEAHAEKATGLSIDEIFLVAMSYLGSFFTDPFSTRRQDIEIKGIDQSHLDRFLAFTCLRRAQIGERLRSEHCLDQGFAYRYSSLRAYPLIQFSHFGSDEIACPCPALLFWRITTGLYYDLKDQPGFPTAFGVSFEEYVGEVLSKRITNQALKVIAQVEYYAGRNRKDTVDWIVEQADEAALFIECKTMRLTWASKAGLPDSAAFEQDIRKLGGALVQVYKTIRDYRAGCYPNLLFVEDRRVFPMIVTLEDWYFFGNEFVSRLERAVAEAMENAGLPLAWINEMPYSVMSIDEFERASGIVNASGIAAFIRRKVEDPEFRRWTYHSYCNDQFRDEVRGLPELFRDEYDNLFAGIAEK